MNKNMKKVLINTLKIAVLFAFMFIAFKTVPVLAAGSGNPIDNPESYKVTGDDQNTDDIQNMIGMVLTIVNAVGTAVAVGVMAIIGIKYIMGSAEERADYKKSMQPYLIGALLFFAAPTVVNIIYNIGKDFFN